MTYRQSCDIMRRCAALALASTAASELRAMGPRAAIDSLRASALRSGDGRIVTAIVIADTGPIGAAAVYMNAIEDADYVI